MADTDTDTYSIIRFYADGDRETVKTDLSLAEAKEHCEDDETASKTATSDEAVARTANRGPWFEGFERE